MGAINKILGTVGGVLGLAVLAGGVAMAVPESRNWILDELAKTSNAYKTQVKVNDELKIELGETKTQLANEKAKVETLTVHKATLLSCVTTIDKTVNAVESDTSMETLDKTKTDILDKYAELNSTIEELQNTNAGNEQTILSMTATQQTLLDCVTAIDSKINGSTDETTLDNLQERKTAILEQVDGLNSEIAEKQSEIDRLTQRLLEIENNSGSGVITDYGDVYLSEGIFARINFSGSTFVITTNVRHIGYGGDINREISTYDNVFPSVESCSFENVYVIDYTLNGRYDNIAIGNENKMLMYDPDCSIRYTVNYGEFMSLEDNVQYKYHYDIIALFDGEYVNSEYDMVNGFLIRLNIDGIVE
ncbi:MAG: hypothetical protein ACI4TT_03845 [Christensenellales bacterium]